MKNKLLTAASTILLISLFFPAVLFAADDITGFWKTVDEETGRTNGVFAVFEYEGMVYSKLIASFDETGRELNDDMYRRIYRSPYLAGDPAFNSLTIIWEMKDKGKKWTDGKIMDPGDDAEKKPAIYDCEMWKDDENLIVRGKILFFGMNQTWYPMNPSELPTDFRLPDLNSFRPEIPEIK